MSHICTVTLSYRNNDSNILFFQRNRCTGEFDGAVFWLKITLCLKVHVPNFGGVAGSEDFASATLPTTPLDFQGNIKSFCHPTLLKIRFKIIVTPPPPQKGQNQNHGTSINSHGLLTLSGLLSLHFLLHMTTSFIKPLIITCKLYME